MLAFTVACFFISLVGILSLFSLKRYEVASGVVLAAPFRAQADVYALELKRLALLSEEHLVALPPKLSLIVRFFVHRAALMLARQFNAAEQWAHRLADRVSHRHHFERRETKSQFLKEVSNVRNEPLEKSE